MCEFCTKHGEGEKWYLQAKNYSADLVSDIRRQRTTRKWLNYFQNGQMRKDIDRMDNLLPKVPNALRRVISSLMTMRQKKEHFGQVVPIEDIERIFEMVNSVVRVPCVCRQATLGREVRCCLGVSTSPVVAKLFGESYNIGPDTNGMEQLTKEEALSFIRNMEKEGVMHSIWTFGTPFIGGVCNCDRSDCVAMRATVNHDLKMMFKAEYVAFVDNDLCTGCRQCMRQCQFGAMGFSSADRKAYIDSQRCYGCGVCRAVCEKKAISLQERSSIPILARNW